MSEVIQGDVDGVPTFWVDSGRPTLTGALVFRTGLVDESLPTTGWTHLLEHLGLHGRGGGALHVNGSVSLLHTRFEAHGPTDRVAETLSAASRWLAAPDFAELTRERSVLRAEAALRGRGGGEVGRALLERYGARGPGLAAYEEPGLSRATPESLRDLAHRVFVRENCALFLDGPPPVSLRLQLPSGQPTPAPAAVPCGETVPAGYLIEPGITLSGVVRRSVGATFLPHIMREGLTDEFRERDGGAYAPWAHYEPVDDDTALVVCGSDTSKGLLGTAVSTAVGQLDRLARGELADDLVNDIREQLVQAATDPYSLPALAFRAAVDHLRGEPPLRLEQAVAEIESTTAEAVVAEAKAFRESLLVGVVGQATWDVDFPVVSRPPQVERMHGRGRRSRSFPADRDRLLVSQEGVQVGAAAECRTVRREAFAGLLAYPDGAREVVADDGWSIRVEPTLWADGYQATRELDELVPAGLHIPMPPRDHNVVPQPLTPAGQVRQVVHDVRRRPRVLLALWGAMMAVLLVGAYAVTGRMPTPGVVGGAVVATVVALRRSKGGDGGDGE